MIRYVSGNLLEAKTEALVNTVNCVGVMGKGIALQFKQAFPDNFKDYARACSKGHVRTGKMFVHSTNRMFPPKYIINFPTKRHWKAKSRVEDIESGLKDLKKVIEDLNIQSIAIPPLGSGLGGLNWQEVKSRIIDALAAVPDVEVLLYEPKGAPKSDKIPIATSKPEMTRGRALLIRLLDIYRSQGYRHTLLEIQKLMYFLQEAGEKLRLKFKKYNYGPYAENLHHVLQRIDGHYIRGYGDRSGKSEVYLLEGALREANSFLKNDEDARKRLDLVGRLIRGFETPYGMELLATVYWVAKESPEAATDPELVIRKIQGWSPRKKFQMQPRHITKALNRLKQENWLKAA
ncbi:MAG: macro domain-containing protein [Deltaproteobacteria bacterium]|nr:macro domain-containing protein [Deltaproteobacteria bacterium]